MKTILAHVCGTLCDDVTLEASLALARIFTAHIEAVLVVPDPQDLIRQAVQIDATNAMLLTDALLAMEQESKDRSREAHATFAAFCKRESLKRNDEAGPAREVTISWKDLMGGLAETLATESRLHDLLVLAGGSERKGRLSVSDLGQIILSSGRPVLMLPERAPNGSFDTVVVAWKDTAESARALLAAMPFLKRAKRVEIISVNETSEGSLGCVNCCEGVVRHLRWHGIDAHMRFVVPGGRNTTDALLETARECGGQLLVMGAYGHSRLREFIFGGVTRRILSGVDMPVFLFH